MIALDMQPLSIVSDAGFQHLIHKLDPHYKLPSKTQVKEHLMPKIFNQIKQKLKTVLQNTSHVSFTTDLWTCSYSSLSYITVTAHFLYEEKLTSTVLETRNLEGSHTSEKISSCLQNIITEWDLDDKVVAIITDNAQNMILTSKLLKIEHIPCLAHTINLSVEDGIKNTPQLDNIIQKCRDTVAFIKRSTKAADLLREEQRKRNEPELKLIQDVSTRWNSLYLMIQRILKVGDSLTVVILNSTSSVGTISFEEKMILQDIMQILEIFYHATEVISGDQYVTVSLIVPLVTGMYKKLNELPTKDSFKGTEISISFMTAIQNSLNKRLANYESKTIPKLACLLDPRFKTLPFKNKENSLNGQAIIQTELGKLFKNDRFQMQQGQPSTDNTNTTLERDDFFTFLNKKQNESTSKQTPTSKAIIITRQYFEQDLEDRSINPIKFWIDNLKPLNQLALKYLICPATSVPSERLFSKSGQLISARRNRLKPKNVNMLLFLNYNLKLFTAE